MNPDSAPSLHTRNGKTSSGASASRPRKTQSGERSKTPLRASALSVQAKTIATTAGSVGTCSSRGAASQTIARKGAASASHPSDRAIVRRSVAPGPTPPYIGRDRALSERWGSAAGDGLPAGGHDPPVGAEAIVALAGRVAGRLVRHERVER